MARVRNAARERLDAGELALGVILRQARTVDVAPIMKSCGYDWLFLDLEHNSMDLDTAVQIAVSALGGGGARAGGAAMAGDALSRRWRARDCRAACRYARGGAEYRGGLTLPAARPPLGRG